MAKARARTSRQATKAEIEGCPRSVLDGLAAVQRYCGDTRTNTWCHKLKQHRRRIFKSGQSLEPWAWRGIMRGERALKYGLLEAIQDASGVPTGAFLASTHAVALLRDGQKQQAREFVSGLRALADAVETMTANKNTSDIAAAPQAALIELFDVWQRNGLDASSRRQR